MSDKVISDEGDVRAHFRGLYEGSPQQLFWVEPNIGSTLGLPDMMLVVGPGAGDTKWCELKVGEQKPTAEGPMLRYKVRPAQKRVMRDIMEMIGQDPGSKVDRVFVAVGEIGHPWIYIFRADQPGVLSGKVNMKLTKPIETTWLGYKSPPVSFWSE